MTKIDTSPLDQCLERHLEPWRRANLALQEANKLLIAQVRSLTDANIDLTTLVAGMKGKDHVAYLYGKPLHQLAQDMQELDRLRDIAKNTEAP